MYTGMRLAEQEMRVLIIKLVQNFRLEWSSSEADRMQQKYVMLLRPDREACIKLHQRTD